MDTDNTQDGAEPSLASGGSVAHPLEQILRGTVRLHELIEQGRCDSDEADAVRDEMDVPFLELSESEREAARLVSAAIKDREWISVTERLPDDDVQCLVWHKNGRECRVAVRWEAEFWEGSIRITSNVTHWMPLPAQPTDGK